LREHLEGVREAHGSSKESVKELSSDDTPIVPTDVTESTGTIHDSRLSRVEGYMARDLEMIVGRAVSEAVSSAVAPLLEEIKQLATVQAAQIAENAALRMEVELMASSQMAAQMAAAPTESKAEDTHEPSKASIEEALDKSLKQVQEMSDEVGSLQAENERLRVDLAKTQRPWWQRFFLDP
jgi:regulator of replication initiation timing